MKMFQAMLRESAKAFELGLDPPLLGTPVDNKNVACVDNLLAQLPIEYSDKYIPDYVKHKTIFGMHDTVFNDISLLPKDRYINSDTFYVIALHEITHYTGQPQILGRHFPQGKATVQGILVNIQEELVAEIVSVTLAMELKISVAPTIMWRAQLYINNMSKEHYEEALEKAVEAYHFMKGMLFS